MQQSGEDRAYQFTSESVSEGHPDKVCDRISDAVLDGFLTKDPSARAAIEVLATTDRVVIAGEYKSRAPLSYEEIEDITRSHIKAIGYEQRGFHWNTANIQIHVHGQSADIAQGVDASSDVGEGAGDQGLMFGYATDETPELIPAPLSYSHRILEHLAAKRHAGDTRLGPDAKSQVTFLYDEGQPVRAERVLISSQHSASTDQDELRAVLWDSAKAVIPQEMLCSEDMFLSNPTGRFVIGGPDGDTGLTGRKIIVDTYGGAAPHGGGAFSGKDPTKVDRSAAYMARYLAKNVVSAGLASKCLIQVAYAIGVPDPVSFYCHTYGTGHVDERQLEDALKSMVNLTPKGIRNHLSLARPIYTPTSAYGHFGRTPDERGCFSWERTDLVSELKSRF